MTNDIKIFTDNIEAAAQGQIDAIAQSVMTDGNKIRVMPDVHAGSGVTIGFTMNIIDKIAPNIVGVDIGCGMLAVKIDGTIDLPKLDSVIQKYVPSGQNIHEIAPTHLDYLDELIAEIGIKRADRSLGSLGGGNHFIELDVDSQGDHWLVIHTGSRHAGLEVANYYNDLAYKELKEQANGGALKDKIKEMVARLTAEGNQKQISKEMKVLKEEWKNANPEVPYELAYVQGQSFNDYIHDMKIMQQFANDNRHAIAEIICNKMGWKVIEEFTTIHNYIDCDNMIVRKGAVSAQLGEKLIIPMNMKDGSLICIGKGNADWNYSAPHGAGRLMSRSEARKTLSMDDYKDAMSDIYTSSVSKETIDEAPMAYKPMQEIINNIQDTVEIIDIIKPIYNFKAKE